MCVQDGTLSLPEIWREPQKVIEENKLIYFQLYGKDFAAKGNAV